MTDWLDEGKRLEEEFSKPLHGEEAYIAEGDLVSWFKEHRKRLLAAAELAEYHDKKTAQGVTYPALDRYRAACRRASEEDHERPAEG